MKYELGFTIVNSQRLDISVPVEVDGVPACAVLTRTVVEAAPIERTGKTLSLVLPPEAISDFPEGARITISIDPEVHVAPAEQEA